MARRKGSSDKVVQRSFTSGEIAPALRVRADLGKYGTGLKKCNNFFIRAQGGAYSRSGFRYVGELDDSSKRGRLIPFSFNTEQTYILVLEDLQIRVVKDGGFVLEADVVVSGATQANPTEITATAHLYTTGDEVYLSGIVGMTELNGRNFKITSTGANTFTLNGIDSTAYTAYSSGGVSGKIYEVVSPYTEAQLPLVKYTQSADVMTLVHPSHDPMNLSRLADDNWTLAAVDYAPTTAVPTSVIAAASGTGGGTYNKTYEYVVTAVGEDSSESLASTKVSITLSSLSGTYGVKLTWNAVTGAQYYKIYKSDSINTEFYGWIGESKALELTDFNIAPDNTIAPPEDRDPFDLTDDKPSCVSYYQQRQVYANSNNEPQTLWTTQTANYSSLRTSSPVRADDAVTLTIAARQVNEIRHIVALDSMVLMTSGGEWLVTEGENEVLAPDTVGVRIQSYNGVSNVPPVVINDTVVFVQEKGARIRDLGYTFTSDKYQGNDLSIMSEHLFEGFEIEEMAYAYEPYGILWCVRSDGTLLGMTYQKEHEVWGWHRHDTQGAFESVASVTEGQADAVYVIVKRTIDGVTRRYVERLDHREETLAEDCFYVDSGLSYDGAPTTTITGLHHLESEMVVVLADGNVVEDLTVTDGGITLPVASSKVHVGLEYIPEIITLAVDAADATILGAVKSVSEVRLIVDQSRGGFVGPDTGDDDDLIEIKPRFQDDNYDTIALRSFEQRIQVAADWNDNGQIRVVQNAPLPMSVLAVIPFVDLGG